MTTVVYIKVLIVLSLLTVNVQSTQCPLGSVDINNTCINCTSLSNTDTTNQTFNISNQCACLSGYVWSSSNSMCSLITNQSQSSNSTSNSSSSSNTTGNNTANTNISFNCSIPNCNQCQLGLCLNCSAGYLLNSDSTECLLLWQLDCLSYPNSTCQLCDLGYYLLPLGNTSLCLACAVGCQFCQNVICLACNSSYILQSGFCIEHSCNISNCQLCNGTSSCSTCSSGYYIDQSGKFCYSSPQLCDGTQCVIQNCSYCTAISCGDPWYVYMGLCLLCSTSHCKNCYNSTCQLCLDGYYLNGESCILNYCTIAYCFTCNSSSSCGECSANYVYNYTTFQCIPACMLQSSKCLLCQNSTVCSVCQSGYNISNNQSSLCTPLCNISNCYLCQSSSACSSCSQGYSLSTDQSNCQLQCSVLNCNTCQNSTACFYCSSGFSLISNLCIMNCADGSISIGNGSNIYCYSCSSISPLCLECSLLNNSYVCTSCSLIAYLSSNNSCIMCSSSLHNCLQCTSSSTCTSCAYPYSLVNGVCISILCNVANCLLCSKNNQNICSLCTSGSVFISSSLCWPPQCPSNFFLSNGNCQCPSFTMINGTACITCPTPYCITCSTQGCLSCSNGYYLAFNQSCLPCAINCTICTSIICSQCAYGFSLQNNGTCLSVGGGIKSVKINGSFVPCGPGCLVCTAGVSNQIICIKSQVGYFVINGVASKCSLSNCLTCTSGGAICTSCSDGNTIVGGSCIACLDHNAISCLSTNLNYSTTCIPKYSVETSNTNSGKNCLPCADNCLKCDVNGPGNCDSYQCMIGFVQLKGYINCTACVNYCAVCDTNNLNLCLNCGPYRYSDGQGSCLSCSAQCQVCTSALNCSACQLGYTLINGLCYSSLNYPCAITGSNSQCSQCFQGYVLNGSNCVLGPSYNNTGNYTQCPYGYILINSQCFSCLVSSCLACDVNNECTFCEKGYFLTQGSCSSCKNNCLDCSSQTYCNQAADGYYLSNHIDGSSSGVVSACISPCKTCNYSPNYCLTCIDGYNTPSSGCISTNLLTVKIVLGPSSSNSSVFGSSDTDQIKLAKVIRNVNRLLNSFCQILSSSLVNSSSCSKAVGVTSLMIGSIIMNIGVDSNQLKDASQTANSLQQSLISNGMDGCNVVSATVVSNQANPSNNVQPNPSSNSSSSTTAQSSSSTSNMPLILGLSIGLGVLVMIIVSLIAVAMRRKRIEEQKKSKQVAFSSNQIINYDKNLLDNKPVGQSEPQFNFAPSPILANVPVFPIQGEQKNKQEEDDEDDEEDDDQIDPRSLPKPDQKTKRPMFATRKIKMAQRQQK